MDIAFAKKIGLFSGLSDDDLRALLDHAGRLQFRKDQDILRQGQHNDSLYVVEEGILHVRRTAKKHDVLLGRLEAGGFFGEISLFDPGPTAANVRAMTDGIALQIGRSHLDRFLASHPAGAARLLTSILVEMAKRLRDLDERLIETVVWGGLVK